MQGRYPNELVSIPADLSDNLTILLLFGFLGETLNKRFNALARISDWEHLYAVLTKNFQEYFSWDVSHSQAQPMNANDLLWKTKLRFQSFHCIRHAEVESQKRVSSFSCALMGVRPVKELSKCILWDERVRISRALNPCRSRDSRDMADNTLLIQNQAGMVTVHILMDKVATHETRITKAEARFYKKFSTKKTNAASLAQKRSWKDCFLLMCDSPTLRQNLLPADFSQHFFLLRTDDTQHMDEKVEEGKGDYIEEWGDSCRKSIYECIYKEFETPAFQNVMKGGVGKGITDFRSFFEVIDEKNYGSKWTFRTKIPNPKPIRTLAYLFFLTAPANAKMDAKGFVQNDGLDNLVAITTNNGVGTFIPPEAISHYSFEEKDNNYLQMVS
jgi:hypothetical protein